MPQITNVITLAEYANKHDMDVKRLRRIARKSEWPMGPLPFKFGNVWAIDADAPAIVLPDKSTRGTRRADGRQRYIVFTNETELAAVKNIVGDDNVVNPRVAAKSRRIARKLADADATENDDQIVLHGVPMTELTDGTLIVKTENDVDE